MIHRVCRKINILFERVSRLRTERELSRQVLSDKLEALAIYVCRGSISRIEDKQRTVTDIELYGIAKILEVPIAELFENDFFDK